MTYMLQKLVGTLCDPDAVAAANEELAAVRAMQAENERLQRELARAEKIIAYYHSNMPHVPLTVEEEEYGKAVAARLASESESTGEEK